MKKVLSITLTLAMLLGSFLMLVPTVSATAGAGSEPAPAPAGGIYYANDFDDVTATDAAGILASIGWKAEEALNAGTTIAVEEGRLVITVPDGADHDQESFIVIQDNAALLNGYAVDFDMEMIWNKKADGTMYGNSGSGSDAAVSVHTAAAPIKNDGTTDWTRNGRHGWIGQVRWNTNILAGAEGGSGWKPAVNTTPQAAKDSYLKQTVVDATTGEESTVVAATMEGIRVSVRVAYDATGKTVNTYVKAYEPNATFTAADLMQTAEITDASTVNMLTDDFRFVIYEHLKVAIDNVRIGSVAALDAVYTETIYKQNFDTVTGANVTEIMTALGWRTEQEWAAETESSVTIEDGRLVVDAVTDQEEFVVLENNADLLGGYTIECDVEILSNQMWDEATSAWVDGKKDNAVGFVTSLAKEGSTRAGREGMWSQIRAYCGALAGSEDGSGWKNFENNTKLGWFMEKSAPGATESQLATNVRIHWRVEYDLNGKMIKTYAKHYIDGEAVAWTADNLCAKGSMEGYESLLTDDLRFMVYKGMKVALDNLHIFKTIPAPTLVNGESTPVAYGAIDLADYTDGTFAFAVINGSQVVTESGYTMDKYVTSIDVYSLSVNALKGASIRTTGGAALRFRTAVPKADIEGLNGALESGAVKNVEFGTLTIDYATLGALGQLKLDTEGATKVEIADADVADYGTDDLALSCVIEVAADKLNTKYAAAGYVIVEFNDGSKLELTAKYDKYTMVRSVAEIAQTITFDEAHGLSAAQLQVVNTYAAAYVAE